MFEIEEKLNISDFSFQKAEECHLAEMKILWSLCFPEDLLSGFTDFYFAECYNKNSAYVALYENKVCAMAYAPLMDYRFYNKDFKVPYIQGVATHPDFRNFGIANSLLKYVLYDLYNQGVPFGILKPFNVQFYQKSGWQVFANLAEVNLKTIPHLKNPKNYKQMEIRLLTKDNYKEHLFDISAVYEYWQQNLNNNYALRSLKDWELLLADHFNDGGLVAGVFVKDRMLAYALFMESLPSNVENIKDTEELLSEVLLRETAFTNGSALQFLLKNFKDYSEKENKSQLKALISHLNLNTEKDNVFKKNVILHLPINQKLTTDFSVIPFGMLRVINVETLLSAMNLKFLPGENLKFLFHDSVIKKSSGLYALSGNDNYCHCEKIYGISQYNGSEIIYPQIDANLLTTLLAQCYNFYGGGKNSIGRSYFNDYFR